MYISHCKGRNWLLIFVIWIANKLLVAVEVWRKLGAISS
jgi:hypothetical protein